MEKKVTSSVVQGLIISLLLIVFSLITILTGQSTNQSLSYIQYVIFIGGIIISCYTYAKQMDGNVTFGNVFSHGFKASALVIVVTCIYTALTFSFLFPEIKTQILQTSRQGMEAKGLSDSDIEKSMGIVENNFTTFAVAGVLFMFAIVGAVASLIGAAVAKKKPSNPFDQQPV